MLLGINLPIRASSIIYLPLQKSHPHPIIPSVSVVLQAALLSARCFFYAAWGMGGGGAIHVVAVQTLSLRCVVSLSWRCPPVTMGSLACLHVVHVNLFFSPR